MWTTEQPFALKKKTQSIVWLNLFCYSTLLYSAETISVKLINHGSTYDFLKVKILAFEIKKTNNNTGNNNFVEGYNFNTFCFNFQRRTTGKIICLSDFNGM